MDTSGQRHQHPQTHVAEPIDHAIHRLSAFAMVPGSVMGVVGAALAEALGLGHEVAIVVWISLFLAGTAASEAAMRYGLHARRG